MVNAKIVNHLRELKEQIEPNVHQINVQNVNILSPMEYVKIVKNTPNHLKMEKPALNNNVAKEKSLKGMANVLYVLHLQDLLKISSLVDQIFVQLDKRFYQMVNAKNAQITQDNQ